MSECSSAYFLVAHGSRDLRSRQGLEACAAHMRQYFVANQSLPLSLPLVGTGVLEFGDQPLALQLVAFTQTAIRQGVCQVFVLPLFLVSGNHVNQDLPAAVDEAQGHIPPEVSLILCPFLGSHSKISLLVQERMGEVAPCDDWIVLAHGTRRQNGNAAIQAVATQLGATVAYWITDPRLEDQLYTLSKTSALRIGIVPYFLFMGKTIDAIRLQMIQLQSTFSNLDLHLTPPLNPSPLMAKLLLEGCPSISSALLSTPINLR